jgi:hypothetical protein
MEDNIISYKEWEEKYKPTTDTIIDFYEDIEELVSPYHLWTVVDNNPNSVYLDVIPGYHFVNRLGYYVTEVPWTDKDMVVSNDPES